ncbi:TetR/AcrR family transcriptional regulator [Mycolicibacterium sp. S2-37]|uniref:TetR/AcrR family transcriptional regulator n=1 Tax=Mycolicibacterium sp. S2-37 TaxID=2810297 RepID=UPI001A9461A8|nr:TetR/AcrR family transcriptional regulator [Mycolicibacterium sp. S2-37]MBO0678902.1 TetR/AcrR family transcriptional regulator [Mycolicibacterium sp. S2-37]
MTVGKAAEPRSRGSGRGARERILAAATELFYRDGINATGVERLASAASVSKRTLYQHFPSKVDIVEAYLKTVQESMRDAAGDEELTARERILAIFDGDSGGRVRGCPFHNAAVEAADAMPGVQGVVRAQKSAFIDALTELAEKTGATAPELLGRQLAVLFEGAMALATSLDDRAPIADARAAAETLIDSAVPARRAPRRRGTKRVTAATSTREAE